MVPPKLIYNALATLMHVRFKLSPIFCVSVVSFIYTNGAATVPSIKRKKNQINCKASIPKTKLTTQLQLCNVFKTLGSIALPCTYIQNAKKFAEYASQCQKKIGEKSAHVVMTKF